MEPRVARRHETRVGKISKSRAIDPRAVMQPDKEFSLVAHPRAGCRSMNRLVSFSMRYAKATT